MRRTMITLLKKRYKKLSLTQMLVRVRRPQPLKNEEKGKLQLKVVVILLQGLHQAPSQV